MNIINKLYGHSFNEYFVLCYNIAHCLYKMQDFQSALHYISKAIDIIEKVFGKDYGDLNSYIQFKTQIGSHIENKA